MVEIHIRTIAVLDVGRLALLPQRSVVGIYLHDSAGRFIELCSQESRSFPTLSEAEAAGAKIFDGVPEAFTHGEAEQVALDWIRANLINVKNNADRDLLYPVQPSGACHLDDGEEIEFKPTG